MPFHPAIESGSVAVVTGAASGIGLAAALRFASLGLKVALVDLPGDGLAAAEREVAAASGHGPRSVAAYPTDVADPEAVGNLVGAVEAQLGPADILMNNAGIEAGGRFFSPPETWRKIIEVNLWGAIHGVQAFVPGMLARGRPGLVVNTGSKQGITTPPGNAPYNVSKAALKVMTEAFAHELREAGSSVSAHLLVPGFVYTGLTRARGVAEKPAAAWTPDRTVGFMLESLARGDFYILCPDNDVDRPTDEKRIAWAAGDIIENRPALSRWDARYKAAFEAYMKG